MGQFDHCFKLMKALNFFQLPNGDWANKEHKLLLKKSFVECDDFIYDDEKEEYLKEVFLGYFKRNKGLPCPKTKKLLITDYFEEKCYCSINSLLLNGCQCGK